MPKLLALILFLLMALTAHGQENDLVEVSPNIFRAELVLSASLEPRREEFESTLIGAQKRLLTVAKRYHWEHLMEEPLMRKAVLFDTKPAYDDFLRELFPEARDMVIPKTFTAGFEGDVFFAVSPEIYKQAVPQFVEDKFYEKLICHELAHKLHTRIVNGNEEMMGPIWFWEGFATLAAGQFEHETRLLDQVKIRELLSEPKRGDYREYNALTKHFVKLVPLPELIRRSYGPDFSDWLLNNANPLPPTPPTGRS